jgi:hypothetical protein
MQYPCWLDVIKYVDEILSINSEVLIDSQLWDDPYFVENFREREVQYYIRLLMIETGDQFEILSRKLEHFRQVGEFFAEKITGHTTNHLLRDTNDSRKAEDGGRISMEPFYRGYFLFCRY